MFCQKCGSKVIEGAEFCQNCGAKLIKSEEKTIPTTDKSAEFKTTASNVSYNSDDSVSVTKSVSNEYPVKEKQIKRNSKKMPLLIIILAVLILLLLLLISGASQRKPLTELSESDGVNTDTVSEIKLGQTFSDTGISFSYPDDWVILDDGSNFIIVSMIDQNNNADHRVTFDITISLDSDPMNVFSGNETLVRNAVNENMSFIEYKDAMLGDTPAKYLKYQSDGLKSPDINENYFYTIDDEVYWIHCTYTASDKDKYSPIFEKIIASYAVATDTSLLQETSTVFEDDIIREAYSQKIRELAAENSDMTFSLIDLTADDVYELVADKSGYYVNIYSYDNGSVVPIVEERGYGTGGNYGYSYLPGRNILSNEDMDGAGSLLYTSYYCVDSGHRLLQLYNNNSLLYEYPSGFFLGDSEISESEYKDYMIYGDYSYITGTFTADEILTQLSEKTEIRDHFEDTIIFNNTPISSFIGTPIDSITCQWGEPAEYDYGSCRYDGIYFGYNYTGKIVYVTIDPKMCSINGTTLDKCRDDLAIFLGTPQYEGMEADYCMCYYDFTDNGSLYIDMEFPDDTPYQIRLDASYYQQ